jgi:hypothetical protein
VSNPPRATQRAAGGSCTTAYGVSHLDAGRSDVILLAELAAAVASASPSKGRMHSTLKWIGWTRILPQPPLPYWAPGWVL